MTTPRSATIEVEYWTDPLCCWSWAFEAQWRRLRYEMGDALAWRYRMGGMLPDWSSYADPLNSVNGPLQMGPLWSQVRHVSGMPIDDKIWVEDPPASSYLPCVAVKAAEQQSGRAGDLYLGRLREAVMYHRRNIARREVLIAVAQELAADRLGAFDGEAFACALDSPHALQAFRDDLTHARYRNIGRFPTITLRRTGAASGIILVGYRPYSALLDSVRHVAPELAPANPVGCVGAYAAYWGDVLPRELDEVRSGEASDASPAGPGGGGASHPGSSLNEERESQVKKPTFAGHPLEGTPQGLTMDEVVAAVRAIPGMSDAHHVHAWRLGLGRYVFSRHVCANTTEDGPRVQHEVHKLLKGRFGIYFAIDPAITRQPEPLARNA